MLTLVICLFPLFLVDVFTWHTEILMNLTLIDAHIAHIYVYTYRELIILTYESYPVADPWGWDIRWSKPFLTNHLMLNGLILFGDLLFTTEWYGGIVSPTIYTDFSSYGAGIALQELEEVVGLGSCYPPKAGK